MVEAIEGRLRGLVLQVRLRGVPEGYMVLEGVAPGALARCLGRQAVSRALRDAPAQDDPDLATSLSITARGSWVLR